MEDSVLNGEKNVHIPKELNPSLNSILTRLKESLQNSSPETKVTDSQKIQRFLTQELNISLHKIGELKMEHKYDLSDISTQAVLELQGILFQTIDYIYRRNFISQQEYRNFFGTQNNIEIAAINMITDYNIKYILTEAVLPGHYVMTGDIAGNIGFTNWRSMKGEIESILKTIH
jgi:hypothetical protein